MMRRCSVQDRVLNAVSYSSGEDKKTRWEQPPSYDGALFPDMEASAAWPDQGGSLNRVSHDSSFDRATVCTLK